MRRLLPFSAALFAAAIATHSSAQNAPNQPPVDPQALMQQALQNMQNQGITPEDVVGSVRQQMQDGTFNPQGFMQQLQDNGIVDQNMMNQIGQLRNQMQQRVQQRTQLRQPSNLQLLLNAADDEWAVLSPKIQRILDMTNDLHTNIDTINTNQQTPTGPATTALFALSAILNTPDAPEAQIAPKLAAYRAACQTVKADLAAARADLLALLTLRQESILLNMQLIE